MASRAGEIRLDWGGEPDRVFRLGIGQLRRLQEAVDAGPTAIAARCMVGLAVLRALRESDYAALAHLQAGRPAEIVHVREVYLQGLLGAGTPAPEAQKLVRDWVEDRPLAESLAGAYEICMASILGVEDEPVGEPAGEAVATTSPTENSGSPTSTAPEPSSA